MTTATRMTTTTDYRDSWINPRIKIAALWASTMFLFGYVDLFGMFRADVRADIEAGTDVRVLDRAGLSAGRDPLRRAARPSWCSSALSFRSRSRAWQTSSWRSIYGLTIAGSAVGEWNYYILGSAIEAALLAGIVYYAWTWPKVLEAQADRALDDSASRRV